MIRATPGRETLNIPEVTIEMKQDLRSESVGQAKAMGRPPIEGGQEKAPVDAVNRHSEAEADKQSDNHTREQLDSMLAEVEEHFAANNVKLKFNVLEENDTIQVEIVDADGKTIRIIPDDDLLKLSESLKNLGKGFLDEVF